MSNKSLTSISWVPIVLLGTAFMVLTLLVRYDLTLIKAIDIPVATFLRSFQTYRTVQFFLVVTAFGGITGVIAIALGTLVFVRHQKNTILELVTLLAGITMLVQITKIFIVRMRPDSLQWLPSLNSFSFPSGHTTSAVALYGFIAFLLYRQAQNTTIKNTGILLCIAAVLLISFSRLILSEHYFSDVMGGLLLGSFWLLLVRKISSRST
jgi:membrane-associated phospholipid phosphatase